MCTPSQPGPLFAPVNQSTQVKAPGGLLVLVLVLGTSLQESRRFEQQLRGRAGRQGDPGSTQLLFDVSDPLVAVYGSGAQMQQVGNGLDRVARGQVGWWRCMGRGPRCIGRVGWYCVGRMREGRACMRTLFMPATPEVCLSVSLRSVC